MSTTASVAPVLRGHHLIGVGNDRRQVPLMLLLTWAALMLNVLAFSGVETVLPIPRSIGQMITQGSLAVALLLGLLVNRWGVVRSSLFLALYTLLAVVSLLVSIHSSYLFGSVFRACRMTTFVAVLWLLTPWLGRRDMVLLRCHRLCLGVVLASVVLGAILSPGRAFAFAGRLSGALWPIPPTQVAHYAMVLFGTTMVLWLCRVLGTRSCALTLLISGGVLVATHTRTALMAGAIGLLVAGGSLFLGHVRVRRTYAWGAALGVGMVALFASQLSTWALRGQTTQEASDLTGRTQVWSEVFGIHRSLPGDMFGSGMSNMSFNGLPIDSNWVATYLDQGWFGMGVEAAVLIVLLLTAVTHVRGPHRALALFLIVYCLVASVTETGLGSPSPYLLDLTVAAALLAPAAARSAP